MKTIAVVFLFVFFVGCCAQLNGPNRPQTISNIFQIPIQTLTAVSNVAQNTRPLNEVLQRRRRPVQQRQTVQPNYGELSRAARVAGLSPAADGSFFRI